jgi:putative membrane protein
MRILLFLHVLSIAVAIGAGAAHIQLMREASKGGSDARNFVLGARAIQIKTELPGYVLALLTGIPMVVMSPSYLKMGWMHAKLTLVVLLLGYLHLEGRKSKAILRAFTEEGIEAGAQQAGRYATTFTLAPTLFVLAIVLLAVMKPF